MTHWLIIIGCFLFPLQVLAQGQKEAVAAPSMKGAEDPAVVDFLMNPKNPFMSQIPQEIVVQKPVEKKVVPVKSVTPIKKPLSKPKIEVIDKKSLNLKLNGMVWGGPKPQAIINDRIVSEGDIIESKKIESITKMGVRIRYKGRVFFLTID